MQEYLLSTQESAAHAARVSMVEAVPHFPAVFSKEIMRCLSGAHKCDLYSTESQSSAVTAAVAASLAEKRVFLPLSTVSALEEFRHASSLRAPVVAAHMGTDSLALRDSGWLIFVPSTNQELLDSIIQAYMVSEDRKVLLPSVVSVDMQLRESVYVPNEKTVAKMLPRLRLPRRISAKEAQCFDAADFDPEQVQKAMENSLRMIKKVSEKWMPKFRRGCGLFERYMLDDADFVFVMTGCQSETAKCAVKRLRDQGEKAGLLRLRVLRPWPAEEIAAALGSLKRIAVVDQNISFGASGILHTHVKATTGGHISSFIAQKRLSEKDFIEMYARLKKQEKPERVWVYS